MMDDFKNLKSLFQYFYDERICWDYLERIRWNGTIICVHCGWDKIYKYQDMRRYKCAACQKCFRVTKGTIFEKSRIPLTSWFGAIYLYTSHKTGVSAQQISKHLSIGYQAAWFLHHRIMEAFRINLDERRPLPGQWEVDEVYIGPLQNRLTRARHKKIKQRGYSHIPIIGFLHRQGDLFGKVMPPDLTQSVVHPLLKKFIDPMSTIMTDGSSLYQNMNGYFLSHEVFVHADREYARGEMHSNGIEGSFRHFKDAIRGTYKKLSPKYLQRYYDEFCFKYNSRHLTDLERFELIFKTVYRPLKYRDLVTGKKGQDD